MTWFEDWETLKNTNGDGQPFRERLTWNNFIDQLPDNLPEEIDLWVIGGLTRNGFTFNDIDFYMQDKTFPEVLIYKGPLNAMTQEIFNKSSHIGNTIYSLHPTPIPIKIYEAGLILDRVRLKTLVIEKPEKTELIPLWRKQINDRLDALENAQ